MSLILKPGQGLIYMKVGTHAQEPLKEIIARKTREIERVGYGFWGYGGNTCHPQTMVQPFASSYQKQGQVIYLCMQPMDSKHFADNIRASQYSVDGISWDEIPQEINVLGSRYALVIKNLRIEEFELDLRSTKVALGNCMGRSGNQYITGRVDKACLEVTGTKATGGDHAVQIGLIAELVAPYAVHVRN